MSRVICASKLLATADVRVEGLPVIRAELRDYGAGDVTAFARARVDGVVWLHMREPGSLGEWYRDGGAGEFRVTEPSDAKLPDAIKRAMRATTRAMQLLNEPEIIGTGDV